MKLQKKSLLFVFKTVISVSLLSIIILNINWQEVGKLLKEANYYLLLLALSLNILERAELTYKWNMLIRVREVFISFGKLFLINAIGGFWGLFLPSSLGTDVVRGYYLSKNNSEKSVSISSVFIDRVLGMFSLLLVGLVGLMLAGDILSGMNIGIYLVSIFILSIITLYFFQKDSTADLIKKHLVRFKYKKIGEMGVKLHQAILEYKKYPVTLLLAFSVTLLVQITRIFTYYFIAMAFNISIPIVYFFMFIPIIMLVIMLPISVGGLGVREGTFIAFFTLVGMATNDAVIISFSNSIINTLVTLLGGIAFLFFKSSNNIPNLKSKKEINLNSEKHVEVGQNNL